MPNYPWLKENLLDLSDLNQRLKTLRQIGVPYSEDPNQYAQNVTHFGPEIAKLMDINRATENILDQAQSGNYDGDPNRLTEMDALVAYLQMLGTLVDFKKYDEEYFATFR